MELQINGNKIFAPLKNKELALTPEERVRQEYICRLVNIYGYSLDQMAQEVQVNNSHRGQGKARADIVIWKSSSDKNDEASATKPNISRFKKKIIIRDIIMHLGRERISLLPPT